MESITSSINHYDNWACMSDSSAVYDKAENEKCRINVALKAMSEDELIILKSKIKNKDSLKTFSFYFDGLPKPIISKNKDSFNIIMESAAYFFSKGIFTDWKEAIIAACKAYKLRSSLKKGIVKFSYYKRNGVLRIALGSLSPEYFNVNSTLSKNYKPDLLTYWDIDKQGWRCARIESLISFTEHMSYQLAA